MSRYEITVTVTGAVGIGKSALCGEIEILCNALGLRVEWADKGEKSMTGANWTGALEMYQPSVRIVELSPKELATLSPNCVAQDGSAIQWPKDKRVCRREDMSPDGTLIVGLDSDNDVYVEVSGNRHGQWQTAAVEFCNGGGGGGQSSRTRAALINLMTAIEADNAEAPHKAFPPIAQASSQGGAT